MNKFLISSKVIIVVSELDIAGMNMRQIILEKSEYKSVDINPRIPKDWPSGNYLLHTSNDYSILLIPGDQIFTDYFEGYFETELLIYASKHTAKSGMKALLVHTTGVFTDDTRFGGNAHQLAHVPYNLLAFAYSKINEFKAEKVLSDYWTGIEVTHHGPTSLSYPLIYVETGGTETEWSDLEACEVVANTILEIIDYYNSQTFLDDDRPMFIGIGGTHYAATFIKQLDKKKYNVGHILPKYAHEGAPDDIITQMWNKSGNCEKLFLIDKKGCNGKNRKRFIEIIEKEGYPWKYT